MKKSLLLLTFALAAGGTGFAYDGTFGFGIELKGTGALATNDGVTTLYALDQTDPPGLLPTGSTATLSTAWTPASTAGDPTFNLGTFTVGDSLVVTGGSLLTYQGNGDTANDAYLNYAISNVTSFTAVDLPLTTENFDNPGNKRFSTESLSDNLLAGLDPGTYTLNVYGLTDTSTGAIYESNGGANYGATFTVVAASGVVPEPSAVSLLLLGFGAGAVVWRHKRAAKSRLS